MYIPEDSRIRITYKFDWLEDATKDSIYTLVELNITGKMDAYLPTVLDNDDAELLIDLVYGKDKNGKFFGHGNFNASWKMPYRYEKQSFEKLDDLVNHTFDHYKEHLSDKKSH